MTDAPEPTGFDNEPARRPVTAKTVSEPTTTGSTVVIGCRVPTGVVIRAFREEECVEAGPTGLRQYKMFKAIPGTDFVCHGPAAINHIAPNVFDMMSREFPGGFGITDGCPRDVWENWYALNKNTPLVENGLIFALSDRADAQAEARSREGTNSGLEPIDPAHPEKTVGAPHRHVSAIQPGSGENL